MLSCLEFVKNGRLIDGVFTDTLLGTLNIIKMMGKCNVKKYSNRKQCRSCKQHTSYVGNVIFLSLGRGGFYCKRSKNRSSSMGKTSTPITDGCRSIIFYSFNAFQDLELTNKHNFNILGEEE